MRAVRLVIGVGNQEEVTMGFQEDDDDDDDWDERFDWQRGARNLQAQSWLPKVFRDSLGFAAGKQRQQQLVARGMKPLALLRHLADTTTLHPSQIVSFDVGLILLDWSRRRWIALDRSRSRRRRRPAKMEVSPWSNKTRLLLALNLQCNASRCDSSESAKFVVELCLPYFQQV